MFRKVNGVLNGQLSIAIPAMMVVGLGSGMWFTAALLMAALTPQNAFGPGGSGAAMVLFVAYIIQVQSAAWYAKFTDQIFGPFEAPSAARAAA